MVLNDAAHSGCIHRVWDVGDGVHAGVFEMVADLEYELS
jgi:hypothetical protein